MNTNFFKMAKVTGIVRGKRVNITDELPKFKAEIRAKELKKEIRDSISKYKWVSRIRVE